MCAVVSQGSREKTPCDQRRQTVCHAMEKGGMRAGTKQCMHARKRCSECKEKESTGEHLSPSRLQ